MGLRGVFIGSVRPSVLAHWAVTATLIETCMCERQVEGVVVQALGAHRVVIVKPPSKARGCTKHERDVPVGVVAT